MPLPLAKRMNKDVTAWIGTGRVVEAMACDDVSVMARAVLAAFWLDHPAHETDNEDEAVEQLEVMAQVTGFENYARLIGEAVMGASGTMSLEMVPE